MSKYPQPYPQAGSDMPKSPVGLTPVRDVNDIITRAFNLYKANFGSFLGIMAIGYVAYFLLYFLFALLPLPLTDIGSTTLVNSQGGLRYNSPSLWLTVLASFARGVIASFPLYLASGAVIYATFHRYLGRDFSIAQAFSYALKLGVGLLIIDILSQLLNSASAFFALIPSLGAFGSLFYLVFIVIVGPRFQVGQQALIAEQTDGFSAVRRSWQLVGGDKWSMSINLWFVLAVRTVIPAVILFLLLFLVAQGVGAILGIFLFAVLGFLVTPLFDVAFSIFYLHLRAEREQYDPNALLASMDAGNNKKMVG